MKRGFLVTMSAILLLTASLLFVQNSKQVSRDEERTIGDAQLIDSAAYTFDDIAGDLSTLLGPQVYISRNSSESNITFIDQLPRGSDSSLLSNYSSFIAGYSNGINANISLNFSGVLNGTLLVFSNGLQYDRNGTSIRFYSPGGSTNASAYELNIYSDDYMQSQNISSIPNSGTARLVVHYSDLNGVTDVDGWFDPNSLATYSIDYSDPANSIRIRVGNFSGSSGSIGVEHSGSTNVGLTLTAIGSWNGSMAYAYNANMNYTQLNVTKNDLVWVERD